MTTDQLKTIRAAINFRLARLRNHHCADAAALFFSAKYRQDRGFSSLTYNSGPENTGITRIILLSLTSGSRLSKSMEIQVRLHEGLAVTIQLDLILNLIIQLLKMCCISSKK
jgi:hypothetical protein